MGQIRNVAIATGIVYRQYSGAIEVDVEAVKVGIWPMTKCCKARTKPALL